MMNKTKKDIIRQVLR